MIIGICDDDKLFIQVNYANIKKFFSNKKYPYSIKAFHSGREVLDFPETIDLLFLDIEMPELNGIEVKNELLKRGQKTLIVFLTSHEHFMPEAFDVNVCRFLHKPLEMSVLFKCLDELIQHRLNIKMIPIQSDNTHHYVKIQDILSVTAEDKYTIIETIQGERHLQRKSLKSWYYELEPYWFAQINRKELINLSFVTYKNFHYFLNNVPIHISRTYKLAFREKFDMYGKNELI